jgi:hypothetical protein
VTAVLLGVALVVGAAAYVAGLVLIARVLRRDAEMLAGLRPGGAR